MLRIPTAGDGVSCQGLHHRPLTGRPPPASQSQSGSQPWAREKIIVIWTNSYIKTTATPQHSQQQKTNGISFDHSWIISMIKRMVGVRPYCVFDLKTIYSNACY